MAGIEIIQSLLEQFLARGSRSTALKPLQQVTAAVLSAFLIALYEKPPIWILEMLGVFAGLLILSLMTSYFILLFKNPDALRSEKFHLSKIAIERSITGDDLAGFLEPEKQRRLFPTPTPKSNEE